MSITHRHEQGISASCSTNKDGNGTSNSQQHVRFFSLLPSAFANPCGTDTEYEDGSVVKLRGAFGAKTLFVYDPKALHNIIVKDQHIFEETPGFIL